MEVAILFGSFALLLIIRVPIGISLGMSSLVAILTSGVVQPTYLAQGLVTGADSFPLMAVPFFVLAGELMATGGISRRLLNIADAFLAGNTAAWHWSPLWPACSSLLSPVPARLPWLLSAV